MSEWSDIRCDYCNDEGFWTVDAWKTLATDEDDGEEGSVIAYIDDLTARVIYIDPIARLDEYAQEIIKQKCEEIEKNNKVFVSESMGYLQVFFKTDAGTLTADFENKDDVGTDNVYVGIRPKCYSDDYIDLVGVRVETDKESFKGYKSMEHEIRLYGFDDVSIEDPTWSSWISDKSIKEALETYHQDRIDPNGKIGDFWVDCIPDVGENEGGYFVMIYDDFDKNHQIDSFCIHPEDLKHNSSVLFWIKNYLGLEV